jgi:hypothetical protein
MQTCIQTTAVMDGNKRVISLRLTEPEAERFWNLYNKVIAKNPYITKSHLLRELIELDPPRLATPKEIAHFKGKELAGHAIGRSSATATLAVDRSNEKSGLRLAGKAKGDAEKAKRKVK